MRRLCTVLLMGLLGIARVYADTQDNAVFRTRMLPDNEVPPIAAAGNNASATITVHVTRDDKGNVNAATVTFDIDYTVTSAVTFTGLHIHNAPAGQSGAVVIDYGDIVNEPRQRSERIRQDHSCGELRRQRHKRHQVCDRPARDSRKLLRQHSHNH